MLTIHIVFWIFRIFFWILRNEKTKIWLTHNPYLHYVIHSEYFALVLYSISFLDSHILHSTLTVITGPSLQIPSLSSEFWNDSSSCMCIRAAAKLLSWSMILQHIHELNIVYASTYVYDGTAAAAKKLLSWSMTCHDIKWHCITSTSYMYRRNHAYRILKII